MTEFVVLTPAYNCAKKIDLTIRSVAMQTHTNWEMIILDDMSTDDTVGAIQEACRKYDVPLGKKIKVISRHEKYGEVRNTVEVCEHVAPHKVVVRLDAGDWITDIGCFQILDIIYKQHDPAVMWTNQRWAWTTQSICGPIDNRVSVYKQPWKSSHLKTFRASSIHGINKNNFLDDEGNWIMIACDQAVFLPMMERARIANKPLIYLPMVMYHYDIDLNDPELFKRDRSIEQKMSAERIRERGYIK